MIDSQPTERERLRRFSELLKEARRSIPIDTVSLGGTLRFSGRIGKRVSQQEVAEAIGISRVWYATLEAGQPRASIALLGRICDALMLDEQGRATAFQLCVPEIATVVSQALRAGTAAHASSASAIAL
jgi:DNA-binding XRE family transcriptional regulator